MSANSLEHLFDLRMKFLSSLKKNVPGSVHEFPMDPSSKQSQIILRETALRGVEEMFEALQLLKNTKPHRKTDVSEFDREYFLEEVVDAFNYFFNMLLYVGVTPEEFVQAYEKKHKIILRRIEEGY